MFGILFDDEPTYLLCDNESLAKNTTNVELTLRKKYSAIAYHFTRWNVAAGVISITWIRSDNLADAMTK